MHATAPHLLGLDHEQLAFSHNGLDRRQTDVRGRVVEALFGCPPDEPAHTVVTLKGLPLSKHPMAAPPWTRHASLGGRARVPGHRVGRRTVHEIRIRGRRRIHHHRRILVFRDIRRPRWIVEYSLSLPLEEQTISTRIAKAKAEVSIRASPPTSGPLNFPSESE